MANRNYKKLTPSQEFYKKMRELDAWIKKDMIAGEAIIQATRDKIYKERNEQG